MTERTYLSGRVDAIQGGLETGDTYPTTRNNVFYLQKMLDAAGHVEIHEPGTYHFDDEVFARTSNTTLKLGAGVIFASSNIYTGRILSGKNCSNLKITGDGKIVCTSATAPSFTSVTNLTMDLRVEDASGRLLNPSISSSSRTFSASQTPIIPMRGYRTVLYGDSMTEKTSAIAVTTNASYAPSTGLLTITYTTHQLATGWMVRLFNRNYASLLAGSYYSITRIDANTFTVQLAANLSGLPTGNLAGNTQMRVDAWQSIQGWWTWFQAYNGQRFNVIHNGAQSGDTTGEALSRIENDLARYAPDVVFMQMLGINDLSDGNGPVEEETIYANQKKLIDTIVAYGADLVLMTLTPVAASEAAGRDTLQKMQSVMRLNRRLKDYCSTVRGVTVFDAWKLIVSPTNATGLATAALLETAPDAIHYSARGAELIGRSLWNQLQHLFPAQASILPCSLADSFEASDVSLSSVSRSSNIVTATSSAHGFRTNDLAKVYGGTSEFLNAWVTVTRIDSNTLSFPSVGADGSITGTITLGRNNNLFANPILTTLDGTLVAPISGTEATDSASLIKLQRISGSGSGAASIVARADGYGNNQRLVITSGAASDQFDIELDFTPATDTVPKHTSAGRQYVAECEVSLSGVSGSNLSEFRWNIQLTVDGVTYQWYSMFGSSSTGPQINSDISAVHLKTPPMTMPNGACSNIRFMLVLTFSASGTALTVDIGRIAFRELAGN